MDDSQVANSPTSPRALTYGEKAVGLTFNPGGNPQVTAIKAAYAAIIDQLNGMRSTTGTPSSELMGFIATAITEAIIAQMCAVKAVTWQD